MEHHVPRPCHACLYDVSQTAADGFTTCPECGAPIAPPGAPILRVVPAWARAAFLFISLLPSICVLILVATAFAGDGPGVIAVWIASLALIHIANTAYERWRSPIQAHDRAAMRTIAIFALHIVAPIAATMVILVILACMFP